ncbi:transmembrane protein 271 [Emydura macquarii macquarii]|uniref:transmembrane protein 271 n=1 Tax=Emydura macquarii macquarii TaxID=1129001 RepID=UPI00352A5302
MKWSARGACAALSSCLLLACALSAAAVGIKCFSLGSELKGEPFRLGTAAGAFYSGLLLAAGLSLLGSALLCCRPPADEAAAAGGPGAPPGGRQNFLLLGVLVFLLGVLSAFAGAVIDGDTVALVERKYSHHCGGGGGPRGAAAGAALRCQKLRDYQRGLVLSTVFNALECLLGLLSLLLLRNYKAAQQRGRRRRRRRRQQQQPRPALGGRRRGGGGGRRAQQQRRSQGSLFSCEEPERSPADGPHCQPVSYINVGVFHLFDEAGVEVHGGGHPSLELPGYSPRDPELSPSYPYCYPLPHEQPPAYEEIYPGQPCRADGS